MSNCRECRYYNYVTGICYEMDKEVVNADAGFCIAHETSEAYDLGFDKGYTKGVRETIDKLLNTPMNTFYGDTLKQTYECRTDGDFDKGWNSCYEAFCEVMKHLWQIPID